MSPQKLQNALGPLHKWSFTGTIRDAKDAKSQCACGRKGLKREYIIMQSGKEAVVGSVCVKHFKRRFINLLDYM